MIPNRNKALLLASVMATGLALTVAPTVAGAASLVEIRADGDITRMYIDGGKGRMEVDDGNFVLVDQTSGKLLMVMPGDGSAMDMSGMLKGAKGSSTGATLSPAGNGPTIAGYATKRYRYSVDGTSCGTVYASHKALKDSGAGLFMEAMSGMAEQARSFGVGTNDPCERGSGAIPQALKDVGLPMRVEDAGGQVESEVTRVDTHATLPPNAFEVPAGVKVQDVSALQSAAREHAPQIDAMMQQLQESGQFSPEMMEKMQQMRQQYTR